MLNITFIGNLGNDPEERILSNELQVPSFNVAVNETRNGKEYTTWIQVSTWGRLAIACAEHLAKGRRVAVTAERIQAQPWMAKDGSPRATLSVTANKVKFL